MTDSVPEQACLDCGHKIDAATPMDGFSHIKPGACSVCASCAGVAVYGDDLRLRRPSDAEAEEIRNNCKVATLRVAVMAVNAQRGSIQ